MEYPLDTPTKDSVSAAWEKRHHFTLLDSRLLIENLQGRIYREMKLETPRFSVYFLEQLRTLSTLDRKSHLALVVKPGEAAQGTEVIVDSVTGSFEIFLRGRALFTTVAYLSVQKPEWFSYDDAEYISDKLLTFINQEFSGCRPPLSFYIKAWASTMQRFSETVRTSKWALKDIVRMTSSWEHLWTMWQPTNPSPGGSNSSGSVAAPDDKQVNDEIARSRKLTSSLQSERDKMKTQLARMGVSSTEEPKAEGGRKSWWDGRDKKKTRR